MLYNELTDNEPLEGELIEDVVLKPIEFESDPQSGFMKYNKEKDNFSTVQPDTEVTEDSENLITSGAVYDFINKNSKLLVMRGSWSKTEEDWIQTFKSHKLGGDTPASNFNEMPKIDDWFIGHGTVKDSETGANVIFIGQIKNFYVDSGGSAWVRPVAWSGTFVPKVPKKTSELTNDSGFITEVEETDPTVPDYVKNITQQDISNWDNKAETTDIPTSTSQLTNNGDGTSKFATEDFVEKNGGKIDSISINGTKQPIDSNKNVDIELPSNIAEKDKNNNFTASQTINGTLTVNGDIVQNGESYETHAEQVYTKNDTIILREGAVGGLGANEYAGFEAEKYDGENTGVLGFGADGVARVGDKGNEQPLLTREESEDLADGEVMVWNSTTNRAEGSSEYEKTASVDSKLSQLASDIDDAYLKKSGIELTLKENGAYTLTINK